MYVRYPNYKFGSKIKLPENYSGSAFSKSVDESAEAANVESEEAASENTGTATKASEDTDSENESSQEKTVAKIEEKRLKPPIFRLDALKLFSGGIGFEELLIIALILLISDSGEQDDIVLLLALLLFIK